MEALVIRIYTEKGRGPLRNQELLTAAVSALEKINDTAKKTTGVHVKIGEINGPTFSSTDQSPHFVGRIDTGYVATVLS